MINEQQFQNQHQPQKLQLQLSDTKSSSSESQQVTHQKRFNEMGYQLIKQISRNGNTSVWQGVTKNEKRKIAVKIIKTEFLEANQSFHLSQYENIIQNLKSQHLIQIIQIINIDHYKYILMEYACKGDLSIYLTTSTYHIDQKSTNNHYIWAKKILYQICLALKDIHTQGYVLRDLKPQNILIDHNGKIKLGDFGLSVPVGIIDRSICGTFQYMAPQRLRLERLDEKVDYTIDIWSLGVTGYEILFGELPYSSQSQKQILEQIYQQSVRFPKQFSNEGKRLIKSMLSLNPKNRPNIHKIIQDPFFNDVNHNNIQAWLHQCQCCTLF